MGRRIVLLRGINLGARNRVAMAELRAVLAGMGCEDVRTLGQSGNAVLSSGVPEAELAARIEARVAEDLGVAAKVVLRSRDELADVVARDPLGDVAGDPRRYQVSFGSAPPSPEAVRALLDADVAPERVAVEGREVYAWHPGGVRRSPLARLIDDRRLGVTVTARNWRTVTALLALADDG